MSWTLEGKPLHSILISRLRYLGDVVMSTVVLEVLRQGDPDLEIGYLCEVECGPVLKNQPSLDRRHLLSSRRTGADSRARKPRSAPNAPDSETVSSHGALGMVTQLRQARYDLAVDLFFNPRSAWLLRLSGISRRISGTASSRRHLYNYNILREDVASRNPGFNAVAPGGLGSHLARLAPLVHASSGKDFVPWLLDQYEPGSLRPRLARHSLGPRGKELLANFGVDLGTPFLLMAPGATWRSKEWPIERWHELIQELAHSGAAAILVLSPPGPVNPWGELAESIPAGKGGVLPVLELNEVLPIMSQAAAVVSVDGGILHTAVGLGRPTVGLFGPTRPDVWFPYEASGPFRVLCTRPECHPCHLHDCPDFICLPGLKADTVVAALEDVLT